MTKEFSGYEYGFGTVRGLRSFNVDAMGRLRGITYPAIWKPGDNTAKCGLRVDQGFTRTTLVMDEDVSEGRCDDPDHGCGFWAYHDGSTYSSGEVHAIIEGSGKVTVGTRGFRCEKARIVALCIPRKTVAKEVTRDREPPRMGFAAAWTLAAFIEFGWAVRGIATSNWPLAALEGVAFFASVVMIFSNLRRVPSGCRRPVAHRFQECHCGRSRFEPWVTDDPSLSPEREARLRRNYADLDFFDSLSEMKAAYPVDPALEPTPENDPTFWDDEGSPASLAASLSISTQAYQASLMKAMNQSIARSFKHGGFLP